MLMYTKELTESVHDLFQTMMDSTVALLLESKEIPWNTESQYSAMIGLAGEESGLLYIHCQEDFAEKATSRMLGMDVAGDTACIADALGEIANMIVGNFKNKVPKYKDYRLSLPSVVVGREFSTHSPGGENTTILFFQYEETLFAVQIVMKH